MKKLLAVLSCVLLCSCTSKYMSRADGTVNNPPAANESKVVMLVTSEGPLVTRIIDSSDMNNLRLEEMVMPMRKATFITTPGKHEFFIDDNGNRYEPEFLYVNLEAGNTYYIRVQYSHRQAKRFVRLYPIDKTVQLKRDLRATRWSKLNHRAQRWFNKNKDKYQQLIRRLKSAENQDNKQYYGF